MTLAALAVIAHLRATTKLPYGWDYDATTNTVTCGGCCFRFGAEHPDGDGRWTCPNCGDGNRKQEAAQSAE